MAIQRIVDTVVHDDDAEEQIIEVTLRPQRFDDYVGQERLKRNLKLAIEAAKNAKSQSIMSCFMALPDWARLLWPA